MRIEFDKAVARRRRQDARRGHVLQVDLQLRLQNLVQRLAHLLSGNALVDVPDEERSLILRRLYTSPPAAARTRATQAVPNLDAEHAHRGDQRLLPRLHVREVNEPVDARFAHLLPDSRHALLVRVLRTAVVQDLHLAHAPAVAEGVGELLGGDARRQVVHEDLVEGVGVGVLGRDHRVRLERQHALALLQRLLVLRVLLQRLVILRVLLQRLLHVYASLAASASHPRRGCSTSSPPSPSAPASSSAARAPASGSTGGSPTPHTRASSPRIFAATARPGTPTVRRSGRRRGRRAANRWGPWGRPGNRSASRRRACAARRSAASTAGRTGAARPSPAPRRSTRMRGKARDARGSASWSGSGICCRRR